MPDIIIAKGSVPVKYEYVLPVDFKEAGSEKEKERHWETQT
jgi:hypothetical protein